MTNEKANLVKHPVRMKWGKVIKMPNENDNGNFKVMIKIMKGTKEQQIGANFGDMLQVILLIKLIYKCIY